MPVLSKINNFFLGKEIGRFKINGKEHIFIKGPFSHKVKLENKVICSFKLRNMEKTGRTRSIVINVGNVKRGFEGNIPKIFEQIGRHYNARKIEVNLKYDAGIHDLLKKNGYAHEFDDKSHGLTVRYTKVVNKKNKV